ncbi:sugar ABC transporter permease [Microbacterium testaceum]|uniref:carbohydrate ABC transporter permease n=1 Tax=Microbacterium testaceum TaxID=2033 RepID=UPI003449E7A3
MTSSSSSLAGSRARVTRPRASRTLKRVLLALCFLAPLLAFYGVYYVYSFVLLGQTSQQRVSLSFLNPVFVGLDNFRLILTDEAFIRSLVNNLLFAAVSIAASLTLGFFVAMMLATGTRFNRAMYVVFLLPSLIPLSLFASVFGRMLQTQDGAVNVVLRSIGLGAFQQDWLGSDPTAYAAVFVLLVYLIGLPIMYYRSDVSNVNVSVLEAALLDGASTFQTFRLVLFPLLRTTHITVVLSVLLGSFRAFDLIFFSTGGAPSGRTGITGTYIYQATLGADRVGYAAAASIIVLVIALIVSLVQIVITRRSLR